MIDTHCHLDLFENPIEAIKNCESADITTIGMTNLPSHFELGFPHVMQSKKVRLSLGMHPLYAEYHKTEFLIFKKNVSKTSYIGEIGLDFSTEGIATKEIQLVTFQMILKELSGKKKILSLHSRKAEKEVFKLLVEYNIKNAIFHWYSGPLQLIEQIASYGFYFSVNTAMIKSKSGQLVVGKIPTNRMLTESDGPFIKVGDRHSKPEDVGMVLKYLAKIWKVSFSEAENMVNSNFRDLISNIR